MQAHSNSTANEIWSIGHSTGTYEQFIHVLKKWGIDAVADVRSSPYSKRFPQFSRVELKSRLANDGLKYVFLGKELGGRPEAWRLYTDGVADYEKMAREPSFEEGLLRLLQGAAKFRIAMMCSERNPLDCHRCLLVGRALSRHGVEVKHIRGENIVSTQSEIEEELLSIKGKLNHDFFKSLELDVDEAYRQQSMKVAYAETAEPLDEQE